ncbi:MAG: type II toxin-antitoxin system PemK/MazF family toxin [Gammaproteobacteria bacterium]|nr:type II toxin-antitoxin system PemK/MazF family toxin [Gammaproteobacteria bacterium]
MEQLSRGGIYVARLDPAKGAEIGKLRPVAMLSAREVLQVDSPLLFIFPLSSRSDSAFDTLHVTLPPRDGFKVKSYALVEHCRAVSRGRVLGDRIALLTQEELAAILHRLQRLVGLYRSSCGRAVTTD